MNLKYLLMFADKHSSTQEISIMDATINNAVSTAQSHATSVGMAVLKKANEGDSDTAMQLVNASAANLPSRLGRNINTIA
jgi:hypothetical protein